jgi:serine protease Do
MRLSKGFLKGSKVVESWLPLLRRHVYLVVVLVVAVGVIIEGAYRHSRATVTTPAESVEEAVKEAVAVPSTRFVDKSSWVYLRDYVMQVVGSATPSLALVGESAATGVFIEPDLILVSATAIETIQTTRVELSDGTPRRGSVVGMDEELDVALIRLNPSGAGNPLAWGPADEELSWVVAVGLNRSGTPVVSLSLLSAANLGDEVTGDIFLRNTDLDLPLGAASAVVLDFDGQLAGYIPGRNGDRILWGDDLRDLVQRLKGQGHIRRPWIGLQVKELDPAVLQHLKRPSGLLVSSVFHQGPAWDSGVRAGDLLIEIGGRAVKSAEGYQGMLTGLAVGSPCDLKVSRRGRTLTLKTAVGERSERQRLAAGGDWIPSLGASLKPQRGVTVSEGVRVSGLRVTFLARGGPAFAAGIRTDDLLLSLDGRSLYSPARLRRLLRKPEASLLQLVRGDQQLLVLLQIPRTHEAP